jgi:hypothetical protein
VKGTHSRAQLIPSHWAIRLNPREKALMVLTPVCFNHVRSSRPPREA